MHDSSSAVREGGSSVLDASLEATLSNLGTCEVADLILAGVTPDELVRMVATTPPFNSALAWRIKQHLLVRKG